jgi:hypothetical protein
VAAVAAVVVMVRADPAAPGRKQFLTDQQWEKVAFHSGLLPEARAIATYRRVQSIIDARKTPAETRLDLDRLRKDTEALLNRLAEVMAYADAFCAFTFPIRPPNGWPPNTGPVLTAVADQRLASAVYELRRLACWLGLARDRVQPGKRGAKRRATPAYFVVNHLNEILERFTGKKIVRSTKNPGTVEYVKLVCRIADPKIGDGTIIDAIKKEIKYYKPFGEISPNPTGVIPPPNLLHNRSKARKYAKRKDEDDRRAAPPVQVSPNRSHPCSKGSACSGHKGRTCRNRKRR